MLVGKLFGYSIAALAGLGALFLITTAANAAGGCGSGMHRSLVGVCRHDAVARRHCQPGFHAVSFPNGDGYRCVPTRHA
jgi:hypothetical protein